MVELKSLLIESVWGCVPANALDNRAACAELVGAAKAEAIVKSTGFAARRVLPPGRTVFDLMLAAAQRALEGVDAAEVGGVVAVSFSASGRFPALSALLQTALGLPTTVAAMDLQLACAGYPYGLMVAGQLAAATGRKVLLVDGDVQSAHVDAADVNTLAVMSDAATATLVSAGAGGPARFDFHTDGAGAEVLRCGADGTIRMDGFGVFRFVAGPVAAFLKGFAASAGAIDLFVPHQANMYMVRQLAKSLGLADRLITSGERFANPGSCSVALTLAANAGRGRALLTGFGAGLQASAACVEIGAGCRRGVVEI
ncbi:MAG: 3-oxoacyl-ACP synthase III family protein [Kiritimatiellia bacterium]